MNCVILLCPALNPIKAVELGSLTSKGLDLEDGPAPREELTPATKESKCAHVYHVGTRG